MDEIKSRKQQRLDTDGRIINSAVLEFAKHGYKGAKVTEIAKGADISQGRIAQNFGSKKKLFLTIVQNAVDSLSAFLVGKEGNWRELLHEVFDCISKSIEDTKVLCVIQMMGITQGNPDTLKEASEIAAKALMQSKIPQALKEGQARGEIIEGDLAVIYSLFYRTMSSVLTTCKAFNICPPKAEWFLQLIAKGGK